jgi:hypothetical protein
VKLVSDAAQQLHEALKTWMPPFHKSDPKLMKLFPDALINIMWMRPKQIPKQLILHMQCKLKEEVRTHSLARYFHWESQHVLTALEIPDSDSLVFSDFSGFSDMSGFIFPTCLACLTNLTFYAAVLGFL